MKKILGLDLGTASIGWAFVNEAENNKEQSTIIKTGVRVIHYGDNVVKKDKAGNVSVSNEPIKDFEKGMALSLNAGRTKMRGMRRNLQRYKQRRENLIQVLKEHEIICDETALYETGKNSTLETQRLRAKAAKEAIKLEELARVLLHLNKKRGYKSSRKAKSEEEGSAIDSMGIAKELYERNITPGKYVHELLQQGKKVIPNFYRSDLQHEFDRIWQFQRQFYPKVLTNALHEKLTGLARKATAGYFTYELEIELSEIKRNGVEKRSFKYALRAEALTEQKSLGELANIFTEINGEISNSSGYLGAISDRSKELYFNNETVGQYLYKQIENDPHARLKKQVFYRQDYLDEFEKIWEVQSKANPILTADLKREIRDVIIFYQRRLKSQKHLIANCEFEKWHKAVPKSSPLFQEFRILQNLNNIRFTSKEEKMGLVLNGDQRDLLLEKLSLMESISDKELLKILELGKEWKTNFKKIEGNRTFSKLMDAFVHLLKLEEIDLSSIADRKQLKEEIEKHFKELGFRTEIMGFDIPFEDDRFDKDPAYEFWHLLYSAEDDEKLKKVLKEKYGFNDSACSILANLSFETDYARLSSRAIRRILPNLREGHDYYKACDLTGYNHSRSFTKEENDNRQLKDKLDLIPMNSLRNPIVEKILNQVVNQVNAIMVHPDMGRPDEIRIEMARELKNSADERREMTDGIGKATARNAAIKQILQKEFNFKRVSKNDILRYKLWEECGHTSIYTGKTIPRSEIFGNKYDIEHIIPKSKLFDDSYSNKILCEREWNEDKDNQTAFDFLKAKLSSSDFENYKIRVEKLYKANAEFSKTKYRKLLMPSSEIPDDFIERQLRESQYIARKAKELLLQVTRNVSPTIGSISSRLREDWELMDLMKELNWNKYDALGKTEIIETRKGKRIKRIKDWSKRDDHRHHAMDALTVAFTKRSFVQYLNNLNARNEDSEMSRDVMGIQQNELYRDSKGKLRFKPPMPNFREEAKKHLNGILISFKASSKVATLNKNKSKQKGTEEYIQQVFTPRGQLHKETVYGKINRYVSKEVAVNAKLTRDLADAVANQKEREAIINRLEENGNDPKRAFAGKNSINKNPIYLNGGAEVVPPKVKMVTLEGLYTIRKEISPDLRVDKVVDEGAKRVLQKRLDEYGGVAKEAFSNLDENPIWLNKEKGIQLKRVKITGVKNAEALHVKRDISGRPILDDEGKEIPNSFVSTGNNHHVAIYEDEDGNLSEEVVSFFEAVQRLNGGEPVVRQANEFGHPLKFSMKQNEYFVFPSENFDINESDLKDTSNSDLISPNLFRVQKLAAGDYTFRHHLETTVDSDKVMEGKAYKRIRSAAGLRRAEKVWLNRLGEIIKIGE